MRQHLQVAVGEVFRWYLTRARHPFRAYILGHYWSWFERRNVWVRYDGDGVIHVRLGDYVQQRIFLDGYYEKPLIDWLSHTLTPADVFWDVGANVGALTLVAARRGANVVAFEPDSRSRTWLERNVAANGLTNVTIVAAAVGAQRCQATLHQADATNLGRSSVVNGRLPSTGDEAIAVTRADDYVSGSPERSPTIMKIDVEGAEHEVLAGATALLKAGTVRAIVFEDRVGDDGEPSNTAAVRLLKDSGYAIVPFAASDPYAEDGMLNFLATLNGVEQ